MLVEKNEKNNIILRKATRRELILFAKYINLIDKLKTEKLLTEAAKNLLQIYKNYSHSVSYRKVWWDRWSINFTDEQKHFALSLHHYSPPAYEFLRKQISSLPSQRTVRS